MKRLQTRDMTAQTMRVIHVINSLAIGGAERFVLELLREWERDDRVDIQLVLLNRSQPEYNFYVPHRRPIVLGFEGSWRNLRSLHNCVRKLQKVILDHRAQIVHTHLWLSDFIGALAVRQTGVTHVSHIHNELPWMVSNRIGFRIRRLLFAWALRRANTFFIWPARQPGLYTLDALGLQMLRHVLIPYGIDFSRCTLSDSQVEGRKSIIFGTLGRFVPEKGHMTFLDATKLLVNKGYDFKVVIAGYGPLEHDYRRFISDSSLESIVSCPGIVSDVARFYASLDVYVQPSSSSECLPIVIIEAMASSCPVVGTHVGGIPEIVRDGVSGLVVPPNNPAALASAMEKMIREPHTRRFFAKNAVKQAKEHYDIKVTAASILSLYQDLLGNMRGKKFGSTL